MPKNYLFYSTVFTVFAKYLDPYNFTIISKIVESF